VIDFDSFLPFILILLVNFAVIFRRIGKLEVPAWTAFMVSAILLIFISSNPEEKFNQAVQVVAKKADVFVFLFTMMVLVTALEMSGTLDYYAKKMLDKTNNGNMLLLWTHIIFGLSASVLINDTVAIFAPIMLITFARQINQNAKPFILAVAFGLTYGSALLPTGNPQNFILASSGHVNFLNFFLYAFFPTMIALFGSYMTLRIFYRSIFNNNLFSKVETTEATNFQFEHLRRPSLAAFSFLLITLVITSFFNIPMGLIFLFVVGIYLFLVNERNEIIARIDWGILFFFAGMFITIDAITSSNIFSEIIKFPLTQAQPNYVTFIIFNIAIFIMSQFLSNVPVAIIISQILPGTALNIPIFWMATALTTTFAGGTSVLGAASNIIVIESSKKRGVEISWLEFTKIGIFSSLFALIVVIVFGFFII
jgi:Na+/H+ antiporter NhaD/arsenite permease-like protein